MLDDRSYMRAPSYGQQRSLVTVILVVNAVAFVLQQVVGYYFKGFRLEHHLALSWDTLKLGYVWQLLTFQLLHGGTLHLILNCWGIHTFGRAVEDAFGRRRFLEIYLLSGVAGGLFHVLGSWVFPGHFGGLFRDTYDPSIFHHVPVLGASAGVFGLIAAFAVLFYERAETFYLFMLLPVSLSGRLLLGILAAFALLGILVPTDQIAHGAHLGGLLFGLLYVRLVIQGTWSLPNLWPERQKRIRVMPRVMNPAAKPAKSVEAEVFTDDFITREVDAILDKITARGIQSLTERERRILEAARARMSKR